MYILKIPKRSCVLMGAQRCGKTFAMHALIAHSTKGGRIMVIGDPSEFRYMREVINEHGGDPNNMTYVAESSTDIPAFIRSQNLKLSDFNAVFLLNNTVRVDRETVELYNKPTDSLDRLFARLREPTAWLPKVFIAAAEKGYENEVAQG